MDSAPTQPLESYLQPFGLTDFRPGQRDVIESVLSGKDCMCIMPTGGGKSLCYQLPSIARGGVTLVVSPLIALMKDQVDVLQSKGIRADFINSTLSTADQQSRLDALVKHEYDLLYVAPERFRSPRFTEAVREIGVGLLAIDEAHCISEWGHDFRHDYAKLGKYRSRLGNPQTIALTATATPDVQADILNQLELDEPDIFIAGFARPNLTFLVEQTHQRAQKESVLLEFIRQQSGGGIIYASTRKACGEVAELLRPELGSKVGIYHAGLTNDERRAAQESFMSGKWDVVVATNAFGMGIDKADVRFVVHYNIPGSVEAYYQEAGRAGRDGEPSDCLLLYSSQDRYIQEFFIENAYPAPSVVCQVYDFLRGYEDDPIEITQEELRQRIGLSIGAEGIGTCERLLEKAGALERLEPHRNMAIVKINSDLPTLVDMLPQKSQLRRRVLRHAENVVGELRHQEVYFQPNEWAATLEMQMPALSRTLRELSQLASFEYVPPFRGRAIHFRRRDVDFSNLDIDFSTMEKRKEADYAKLHNVISVATSRRCRQLEMLEYFGDPTAEACGICDNCDDVGAASVAAGAWPTTDVSDDPAVVVATRMALSGVARAKQRFGKSLIAAMLGGSRSAKITKWKLDKLSTFGILRHLTQVEITQLLDALISCRLLTQNEIDRFRPIVHLSEKGIEVMRGAAALDQPLRLPNETIEKIQHFHRTSGTVPPAAEASTAKIRSGQTKSTSNAPAEPAPLESTVSIPAPSIAETAASAPPTAPPSSESSLAQSSYYWTWRLFQADFRLDEIVAIRGLSEAAILSHATECLENGLAVSPMLVFDAPTWSLISQVELDGIPVQKPNELSNSQWKFYEAWHRTEEQIEH